MNTPNIRFKGFTEDWEKRKLGYVVEEFYNGQTPYRQNKIYWDGDINWLSSGDLNRGLITNTVEKITEEGKEASGLKLVPKGTLVIAIMGLEAAGTRGNCGILAIDTTINQACMALIVDSEQISSDFLFQWYKRFGNAYALKFTQGTKQQNYNAELLADLDISYPKIEEQTKIGEYFSRLDNLITLHQRKCDSLKQVKKYMLHKMFPKQEEKVPEIRFAGFTGDWEQRKLSALCEKITVGIANSATHAYTDDGVVMFRNQNIKENYLDDSDVIHIDDEFEQKYVNKRLMGNDLLVARTGYPGTACVVPAKYEGAQTFTTLIARLNEGTNPYYACQYINSDYGKKYFLSTQIGGGQKNSGAGILDEFPMILPPTIEEQNKIAGYLSNLDNLITLHQRKSDSLKEIKKFMLQNMFPNK